jgi:hypothetical protein
MSRHAVSFLEIKTLDEEQRTLEGWASRPQLDRMGDIVESRGAQFRLPLPLLLDHVHSSTVGEVFDANVTDAGIRFKARIAKIGEPGAIKDLCDSAWQAAKAGLRKAVSIGFRPLESEPIATGTRFKKWEWYELSMVSVPALASATIDQVRAYDQTLRAKAGTRVVRLDDPLPGARKPAVVVKLGDAPWLQRDTAANDSRPVAEAMLKAVEDEQRFLEQIKDRKALPDPLTTNMITAGAKATDAELAALRARLDKLEGNR